MTGEVQLDPPWKQAVHEFLGTNPKPGDIVKRERLEKWLGMRRPLRGTFEEIRNYELRFLSMRDRWAEELMKKHQLQFSEKEREEGGWRVLAPHEVAKFTRRQSDRDLKKALRKQRERLAFTDLTALDPPQQREHAETLIRCSWKLKAMKEADKMPVQLPMLPIPLPRRKGNTPPLEDGK
jgi:hypothetical protein